MAKEKADIGIKRFDWLGDLKTYLTEAGSSESAKRARAYSLFRELYYDEFKVESDAEGADGYVEGKFVLELKTSYDDWLPGLFQALHYQKKGLSFPFVIVITHQFIGLWRVARLEQKDGQVIEGLPKYVLEISSQTEAFLAPNEVGREHARRLTAAQKKEVLDSAWFKITKDDFKITKQEEKAKFRDNSYGGLNQLRLYEFRQYLDKLDKGRIQINTTNFLQQIELMERYFRTPLETVHAFYAMVNYWDITSKVTFGGEYEPDKVQLLGRNQTQQSEAIVGLWPEKKEEFSKYVNSRFIFTNEGSGLTLDYYFSRFDEVLAKILPEYVKQHGIFFTDDNLAKFAIWFVQEFFDDKLSEKYIVLDPAGGSGNLVTSWRMQLKHKIVSELQPDLLRIIERRLKFDPLHLKQGFTVVPKTSEGRGLNFLDISAEDYLIILSNALKEKNQQLDKPIAYILNPPYKNTDENESNRTAVMAEYEIHPSITAITGADAEKERYLAFLAQILCMAREQVRQNPSLQPLLMVFTPTSWLIPRSSYVAFRAVFDQEFEYVNGFLVKAGEFFKLPGAGSWPVSFTLWKYKPEAGRKNEIELFDFSDWTNADLTEVNWLERESLIKGQIHTLVVGEKNRILLKPRGDIRDTLPLITEHGKNEGFPQNRYNSYRNRNKNEFGLPFVAGFPKGDSRHSDLAVPYGNADGGFVSFMDDATPVRVYQDRGKRMSIQPDRVWFRLDNDIKSSNRTRLLNGAPDKYGFCAFDIISSKSTFSWFAITKSLLGVSPLWANQYDIWAPNVAEDKSAAYYALCFAFGLAENRCVVTRFEANNPVAGAPEIFLDNPLAPTHPDNFWTNVLAPHSGSHPYAAALVLAITELYEAWDEKYTMGRHDAYGHGLADEPYFKYFSYKPFVTPYSGLIQIQKVAVDRGITKVLDCFKRVAEYKAMVKDSLQKMLVEDFGYFK